MKTRRAYVNYFLNLLVILSKKKKKKNHTHTHTEHYLTVILFIKSPFRMVLTLKSVDQTLIPMLDYIQLFRETLSEKNVHLTTQKVMWDMMSTF